MKQPSKKVHLRPGSPDDRLRILDIEASINATPAIAKAAAQRQAVLEAGCAVEFWMKNARRTEGGTGLKQAELARILGVSQARISQLVNAEGGQGPSYALLRRICLACGFSWPNGLLKALQGIAQDATQPDLTPTTVQREQSSKTPFYELPAIKPIVSPKKVKRVARFNTRVEAASHLKLQPHIGEQISTLASSLGTLDDVQRSIVEAAIHNLLQQTRQPTASSDEFAIVRVDQSGNLDLEHMTIIETGGKVP